MTYNEHAVVPVILCAAVRNTSRNALQKICQRRQRIGRQTETKVSRELGMVGLHWADALAFLDDTIDIRHVLEV
jgi:hypothetical protein